MPRILHPLARVCTLAAAIGACWLAAAAGGSATAAPARSAPPKVPPGFVGVNVDQALVAGGVPLAPAFATMVGAGVQSVRAQFDWTAAQPTANGPYDFSGTDRIVAAAAQAGITVLPVVLNAPAWDALPHPPDTIAVPKNDGPYGAFLSALVRRYGPHGTFWTSNPSLPKRPIHEWQIWNEPNFTFDWTPRPFAPGYVALLKVAHRAIKGADPTAKVVLAGMPNDAWKYLQKIYDQPGASRYFDVVAAHPYTTQPKNVIRFLRMMRAVMNKNGDAAKPLVVTEMGWNSSIGHRPADNFCCQVTAAKQASKVAAVLPLLAAARASLHLQGFYYYTWASHGTDGGPSDNWAGMFQIRGSKLVAKPVFAKFKAGALAIEHCRRVGRLAGSCAVR